MGACRPSVLEKTPVAQADSARLVPFGYRVAASSCRGVSPANARNSAFMCGCVVVPPPRSATPDQRRRPHRVSQAERAVEAVDPGEALGRHAHLLAEEGDQPPVRRGRSRRAVRADRRAPPRASAMPRGDAKARRDPQVPAAVAAGADGRSHETAPAAPARSRTPHRHSAPPARPAARPSRSSRSEVRSVSSCNGWPRMTQAPTGCRRTPRTRTGRRGARTTIGPDWIPVTQATGVRRTPSGSTSRYRSSSWTMNSSCPLGNTRSWGCAAIPSKSQTLSTAQTNASTGSGHHSV